MHIPGQQFGRVWIKPDRDLRFRFADLQGQFFKGESQKGTAENYNFKPFISVRYCVHALPLCLAWRAIVLQALSTLSDWRRRSQDALWKSPGPLPSHLLTIFFHFCVTLLEISLESKVEQQRVSFSIWPKTTYKLYTFFKYYGMENIWV